MTREHSPVAVRSAKRLIGQWVMLGRSVLTLTLGIGLILHPDKTRPMPVNFIGMFWLMGGVLILGRYLLAQWVGEVPLVQLLGAIIVLTGLVHVREGFRAGPDQHRQLAWTSTLLGGFEMVLGIVALVWRDEFGPVFYALVTIWAFLAAVVLLCQALQQRARVKAKSGAAPQ